MNPYLFFILLILIGTYLLNLIVDVLNLRHVRSDLPEEFNGYYDEQKYKESQEYLKANTRFAILTDTVSVNIVIGFVVLGGFNLYDRFARSFGFGEIMTGLIFSAALLLTSQVLSIPVSVYETFVIEERYGFNRTRPKTFILDILKTWLLTAALGSIVLACVLWFFYTAGNWAWFYCWIALTLFQFFLLFVAPVTILPIFNKFSPLQEGDLRRAIEDYANKEHYKMKGVFTMDGSKRSTRTNAFFIGFGKFKRIVLYDTLIAKHEIDELLAILAHEMGHYKKKHVVLSLGLSVLNMGFMFFVLSFFINNEGLFLAFKMDHISVYASLLFFGLLYSPIQMLVSVLVNLLSRHNEYEADTFAVMSIGNAKALIRALKNLSVENLSNLTPHPFKVLLEYSHPPVLERIKAIRRKMALD
jgi:STE24 endopeptidase